MRYNKWKDECLFWKGVFAEKFIVNGRETTLAAYISNFRRRRHHNPKLTKLRSQFWDYLSRVADDMCSKYHNVQYLAYSYLYEPEYISDRTILYNPYIGITKKECESLRLVSQMIRHRGRINMPMDYPTEILDAIEEASGAFDAIRAAIYNIKHPRKKKPIPAVANNYLLTEGIVREINNMDKNTLMR